MPTYDFNCEKCDKPFSVVRSIKETVINEECPLCGNHGQRLFGRPIVIGAAVQDAEYNPAFGKVIKSKREREELAKQRGWIEVGNEKPETIHKESEKTLNENRIKKWRDV